MKASELVNELNKRISEQGDLEVRYSDDGWNMEVEQVVYNSFEGGRFQIQ